jgi:hypothetical protein
MGRTRTLQDLLDGALEENDETRSDVVIAIVGDTVATYSELDEYEGDVGWGSASLPNMHAWTSDYVYFKHVYDGSESVRYVPRNPTNESLRVP